MIQNFLGRALVVLVALSALSNGLFVQCIIDMSVAHVDNDVRAQQVVSLEYRHAPSSHHIHSDTHSDAQDIEYQCHEDAALRVCEHASVTCSDVSVSYEHMSVSQYFFTCESLTMSSRYESFCHAQLAYAVQVHDLGDVPVGHDVRPSGVRVLHISEHIPSTIILI